MGKAVSKADYITRVLRRRVGIGELKNRERLPSEYTLAKQFKVARPTITRALTQLVHEGLLERVPGTGTFVAEPKAAPATDNCDIGLIVNDPDVFKQSLMGEVLAGSKLVLQESGFGLKLGCINFKNDNDVFKSTNYRDLAFEHQVGGLLIFADEVLDSQLEDLYQVGLCFVWCGYHTRLSPRWDRVLVDLDAEIEDAFEYLLGLGHERIAFLNGHNGPPSSPTGAEKKNAYFRMMKQYGFDSDMYYRECEWNQKTTKDRVCELMSLSKPPTAIICVDDYVAGYAILSLRLLGLSVPDDVSIIGSNDLKGSDLIMPPLTSFSVHPHKLGTLAAKLLLERLEEGNNKSIDSVTRTIRPTLICRESCRACK